MQCGLPIFTKSQLTETLTISCVRQERLLGANTTYSRLDTDVPYQHSNVLPRAVIDVIKPVYRALSDLNLLKKCPHGKTQSANESYNNMVWARCPKRVFAGGQVLRIAAYDAVLSYNGGSYARTAVIQDITGRVGETTLKLLKELDNDRIKRADAKIKKAEKGKQDKHDDESDESDDEEYGAGEY